MKIFIQETGRLKKLFHLDELMLQIYIYFRSDDGADDGPFLLHARDPLPAASILSILNVHSPKSFRLPPPGFQWDILISTQGGELRVRPTLLIAQRTRRDHDLPFVEAATHIKKRPLGILTQVTILGDEICVRLHGLLAQSFGEMFHWESGVVVFLDVDVNVVVLDRVLAGHESVLGVDGHLLEGVLDKALELYRGTMIDLVPHSLIRPDPNLDILVKV